MRCGRYGWGEWWNCGVASYGAGVLLGRMRWGRCSGWGGGGTGWGTFYGEKIPTEGLPQRGERMDSSLGERLLEVYPELGVAPGLFGSVPNTDHIHAFTREEDTTADLPTNMVARGEEMRVDHVDFLA